MLFGSTGVWRNFGNTYLKVNFVKCNDGVRSMMTDRTSNGFEFYDKMYDLEKKIFTEVEDAEIELFKFDKKQIIQNKQMISEKLK